MPRPHHLRDDRGFSLLELIVVMAVLALAAGLFAPRMTSTRDALRFKTTAVSLAADLRATRAVARRTNVETALVLDVEHRIYSGEGVPHARRLPATISVSFEAQAETTSASGAGMFRFKPDGTATGGVIRLQSASSRASIAIDWLTGGIDLSWR